MMMSAPPNAGLTKAGAATMPAPCRGGARPRGEEVLLLSVTTLVLWLGCLAVGWLGLTLTYGRPRPAPKQPPPIQAEILQVELTGEPLSPPDAPVPPSEPPRPPPRPQPLVPPSAPPLVAVAEATPAIAFPLPVEGPVRIVEANQAGHAPPAAPAAPTPAPATPVQPITYGQGEGKQPAPEYPRQAVREGQEGVVTVRFTVGGDGRVLAAEAVSPAPWPLLNEAALRAVRERWRFRPGPLRLYEVAIRFELKK